MKVMAKMLCVVCLWICMACDNGSGSGNNPNEHNCTIKNSEPSSTTIGNGNYTLHNFIGENPTWGNNTSDVITHVNDYMEHAETYIKGLVNDFEKSLSNRPAAQAYFSEFTNSLKNTTNYNVNDAANNSKNLDRILDAYVPCETIFADIIKNLDNLTNRQAFQICFNVLDNESYNEGLGNARNGNSNLTERYNYKKNSLVVDWFENEVCYPYANLQNAYDQNNFTPITQLTDQLLGKAASNMQNKTATQDVTTKDLRQFVNITMTASSLGSMHDRTMGVLNHKGCARGLNIDEAMQKAIREMYNQEMGLVR